LVGFWISVISTRPAALRHYRVIIGLSVLQSGARFRMSSGLSGHPVKKQDGHYTKRLASFRLTLNQRVQCGVNDATHIRCRNIRAG
jgi:hypothetical protein